jgi:hypothetical protein
VVYNSEGSATASSVLVDVSRIEPDVTIVTYPENQTINVGETISLSVVATGNNLRYRWYHNNDFEDAPITGNPTYSKTNAQLSDAGIYTVQIYGEQSSITHSVWITVNSNSTAIEPINISKILLYPNPVDNELFIHAETVIDEIEIYNIAGRKIVNCQYRNGQSINVTHLPTGIYFVKIIVDNQIVTRKFVKK